jgi:hypothetical protein
MGGGVVDVFPCTHTRPKLCMLPKTYALKGQQSLILMILVDIIRSYADIMQKSRCKMVQFSELPSIFSITT